VEIRGGRRGREEGRGRGRTILQRSLNSLAGLKGPTSNERGGWKEGGWR